MSDERPVRYFRDWSTQADHEVTADVAATLPMYARVHYLADGRWDRHELYYRGDMCRVDYHAVDDEARVRAGHRPTYGDVPFTTHEELRAVQNFTWERVRSFDGDGDLTGRALVLTDSENRGIMQIDIGEDRVQAIEKYEWSPSGDLHYAAKYTGRGTFSSAQDFEADETASLTDIMQNVPDPEFFQNGRSLPRALAGTEIPELS